MLEVILNGVKPQADETIAEEQAGFRAGIGRLRKSGGEKLILFPYKNIKFLEISHTLFYSLYELTQENLEFYDFGIKSC